ncbi:hypothetical protein OSB04_026636 [Centaurea solstitialis]|uniref:F-box domain-containing protein n=1 Tax=Centaurea solstitialis TaxID=347529 RepID=A0AA38SPT6_9ASTR|nr:hypothetical protein OSB04_026636 [Centaurea solstitialis]
MKRRPIATFSIHGYGYQEQQEEDRLSSLPDALLIHILSQIDTRLAVQSSILSKRWVNLWTFLPVLNFDSSFFPKDQKYTLDNFVYKVTFDIFIEKVLAYRNDSIKIDRVSIKVTDHKTMARVLGYALSHRVPNLSIDTSQNLSKYHPILVNSSDSDSLVSFALKGMLDFGKFPNFSGLVKLRLERVRIVESEPFSSFPNLEELFLVNCKLLCDLDGLEVVGFRLSRLTISSCFYHPIPYKKFVLVTPKLMVLELDGLIPMSLEASELPVLDTVHIDCFLRVAERSDREPDESQQKVNLINILRCLGNAKCVHLSPSTVKLLDISCDMLVEETCPFGNLKILNLIPPPNKPVVDLQPFVKAYLLKDCPRAVVTAFPR